MLVGHRIASLDRVQSTLEAQPHRRHLPHHHVAHAAAQTHDSEGMTIEGQQKAQQHLDEEETDEDDNDYAEEDEEESHLDREYLAEAHSEYLRNEELDEGKQHPDEPEYIDIWVRFNSKLPTSRASGAASTISKALSCNRALGLDPTFFSMPSIFKHAS